MDQKGGNCVNALKGATLISTGCAIVSAGQVFNLCQCPERGDPHFYLEER